LFLSGWVITRGANMQKFAYRTNPTKKSFFFGMIPQTTIPGTRILCSGNKYSKYYTDQKI